MNIDQFFENSMLEDRSICDKAIYMAYFFFRKSGASQFTISDVFVWFDQLRLAKPNSSRLKQALEKDRRVVKGTVKGSFKLHQSTTKKLDGEFPDLLLKSEEIISSDIIIPDSVYKDTRGYIENISRQINACYEYNIYDGCSVLMRRLIEILLISTYQNLVIDAQIKDGSGNYKSLSDIIGHAITSAQINLSKEAKSIIDTFRILGNLSAHQIQYNCRKADVEKLLLRYRATVEELLYKSGVKK